VPVWVADLKFYLARALRAAGVGLAMVAWASVLLSEAQQAGDLRSYVLVAAAASGVSVAQWFAGLPPSATIVDLLRPLERDIIAAARERAGRDPERLEWLVARIAALAAVRLRRGGTLPLDRRAWLRVLARLADADAR
jgi:hypothetical protein